MEGGVNMAEHEQQAEPTEAVQSMDVNEVVDSSVTNSNDRCRNFRAYMISWLIIVAYVLIGGTVFMLSESRDWASNGDAAVDPDGNDTVNDVPKPDIDIVRLELLHSLRDIWTGDPDNWTDVALRYLKNYDLEMDEITMALNADDSTEETRQEFGDWFNACFFCLTVISTIGYGHLIPVTTAGYGFLLAYTVVGIPLFFIYIYKVGELLAIQVKGGYLFLCSCAARQTSAVFGRKANKSNRNFRELTGEDNKIEKRGRSLDQEDAILADDFDEGGPDLEPDQVKVDFETSTTRDERSPDDVEIPVVILFLVVLIFVVISSGIFAAMEGWPFLASFYFCVITITTVGFGDYLPSTDSDSKHFFISFYIVTGLLLLSICIHLMMSRISRFSDWVFNLGCCTRARCLSCCSA